MRHHWSLLQHCCGLFLKTRFFPQISQFYEKFNYNCYKNFEKKCKRNFWMAPKMVRFAFLSQENPLNQYPKEEKLYLRKGQESLGYSTDTTWSWLDLASMCDISTLLCRIYLTVAVLSIKNAIFRNLYRNVKNFMAIELQRNSCHTLVLSKEVYEFTFAQRAQKLSAKV